MCHRQGYLPFFFTSHWQVLLSIQLNDVKFWDLVHWQWCICCLLLCLSYYITFHVHATRKESSSESSPRKTIKVPSSKVNLLLLLMNNDVSFVSAPWRIPQRVRYIARVLLFVCRRSRRRPPENQIHYTHNSWLWLWSGERELRNIMLCIYLHYCPGTLRCMYCLWLTMGQYSKMWSGFSMGCYNSMAGRNERTAGWQIVCINWIFMAFEE